MAINIFNIVPKDDYLSFYKANELQGNRIADFLEFDRQDISKATGVPTSNIRYDDKMPSLLRDRMREWAILLNLVAGYFDGNRLKTIQWFTTPNPLLGGLSPRDMIKLGRYNKLLKFVVNAMEQNIP